MSLRDVPARLNHVQKSRTFKFIATGAIVLLAAALFLTLWMVASRPGAESAIAEASRAARDATRAGQGSAWLESGPIAVARQVYESMLFSMASKGGWTDVAIPIVGFAGLSIAVVWLGLGLSYLGLMLGGLLIAWPLLAMPATRGLGQIVFGVVPLTLTFLILMELLRALLSPPYVVTAIARNVLNEAVRMRISVVFIVLLILFLAVIPGMLAEDQPLRYRVQQWLSYGSGIPYVVLALLTVFFSTATVAFEQRDRVIWQTMTKPVSAWKYLLGKWLGVMGLNTVLLGVTAGGVFLFTEYLRHQPAMGEMAYHVLENGHSTFGNPLAMTDDRRILENQVLVARVGKRAETVQVTPAKVDRIVEHRIRLGEAREEDRASLRQQLTQQWNDEVTKAIQQRVDERKSQNPQYVPTPLELNRMERDVVEQWQFAYSTIEPGNGREYEFIIPEVRAKWERLRERYGAMVDTEVRKIIRDENIQLPTDEREANAVREGIAQRVFMEWQQKGKLPPIPELTLRFKINAGTDVPTELYGLTFFAAGQEVARRQATLRHAQVVSIPITGIEPDGVLRIGIFSDPANMKPITFPPDGLEILYSAGGYQVNFLRVFVVMLVKLGFVASVAIAASTFLSFPVACLVTLVVLFAAESAGFLRQSLSDYYLSVTQEGKIDYFRVLIRAIALPIAWLFELYSDLQPSSKLVDGKLVSWLSVLRAVGVLGLWSAAAGFIGWVVFRQRELALYSGK